MEIENDVIKNHRLDGYDVFYVPNFLSAEEEDYVLRKINDSPRQKWKQLANRRLQIWGGEITNKGLLPQTLPSYLTAYPAIVGRLKETGIFAHSPHQQPNHVILNEYRPGQGIMPHEDGPKYFPVVATISLGSHTVFNYYRYKKGGTEIEDNKEKVIDKEPVLSMLLEPRSLVVSYGDMYTSYLHGIEPIEEDFILSPDRTPDFPARENLSSIPRGAISVANWESLGNEVKKRIMVNNDFSKLERLMLRLKAAGPNRSIEYGCNLLQDPKIHGVGIHKGPSGDFSTPEWSVLISGHLRWIGCSTDLELTFPVQITDGAKSPRFQPGVDLESTRSEALALVVAFTDIGSESLWFGMGLNPINADKFRST
ncbi:hypothetical protein NP233_g989 [Leucocoprinus birnbaumii]|uniref:Fe2OG dioxygenase domain-containing protein n=1 Tax=Leucocoprinus birnbaumii TaxID=56174 RepID=A0AAD5W3D4_9AGAR|nr:hypothetical protein NP233_g989 [Leucocoprinus birnbaumii]